MIVTYSDEHTEAEIEVRRATVADGARRSRMSADGLKNCGDAEFEEAFTHIRLYPDLLACSSGRIVVDGVNIWPPTFEQFWQLPEEMVIQWQDAVYQANAHWRPELRGDENEKKG